MSVQGKVVKQAVGIGVFLLEAADGKRYALKGGDAALLQDGLKVTVEGKVTQAVGIGMTGDPVLEVSSYTVLD